MEERHSDKCSGQGKKTVIAFDFYKLHLTVKIVKVAYKRIEIVYITFRVVEEKMECEKSNNNSSKGKKRENGRTYSALKMCVLKY